MPRFNFPQKNSELIVHWKNARKKKSIQLTFKTRQLMTVMTPNFCTKEEPIHLQKVIKMLHKKDTSDFYPPHKENKYCTLLLLDKYKKTEPPGCKRWKIDYYSHLKGRTEYFGTAQERGGIRLRYRRSTHPALIAFQDKKVQGDFPKGDDMHLRHLVLRATRKLESFCESSSCCFPCTFPFVRFEGGIVRFWEGEYWRLFARYGYLWVRDMCSDDWKYLSE